MKVEFNRKLFDAIYKAKSDQKFWDPEILKLGARNTGRVHLFIDALEKHFDQQIEPGVASRCKRTTDYIALSWRGNDILVTHIISDDEDVKRSLDVSDIFKE